MVQLVIWRKTHLSFKGVDDELEGVRLDALNALLHNVVPVLIFHTLQDMTIQLTHHLTLRHRHRQTQVTNTIQLIQHSNTRNAKGLNLSV